MSTWRILAGDALATLSELPDGLADCCVTSPPYWGLRDYGVEGQIGLEETPEAYVARLVDVFREVRRVLRADGTLWLNLGDSYATAGGGGKQGKSGQRASRSFTAEHSSDKGVPPGYKPKDLIGIPWLVAFALRADGWWLRSDIIWAKPNPMPESVQGSHFVRHLVTVADYENLSGLRYTGERAGDEWAGDMPDLSERKGSRRKAPLSAESLRLSHDSSLRSTRGREGETPDMHPVQLAEEGPLDPALLVGCPGCEECLDFHGWIFKLSAGRPTKAHEYMFLLTKSARYYYNAEAIKEPMVGKTEHDRTGGRYAPPGQTEHSSRKKGSRGSYSGEGRNKRSVWTISPHPFKGAHFATFPPKLIEPCILAGSRVGGVVLDPFAGSGTTGQVALANERSFVGIELNPEYVAMAARRLDGRAPLFDRAEGAR